MSTSMETEDDPMERLRAWRSLDDERDDNILRAHDEGHSPGQISGATGLSYRHVQRIIRLGQNVTE